MSKNKKAKAVGDNSMEAVLDRLVGSYCLADQLEYAPEVFKRLGIEAYWEFFEKYGLPKSEGRVYHGMMHTLQVAMNCYEGALYGQLTKDETKVLVIAGIFHDAKHSQGAYTNDSGNIANAVACFKSSQLEIDEHLRLNDIQAAQVVELIKLTEYPYRSKDIKSTLGRILRDADVMSLYTPDPDDLLDLILGLYREKHEYDFNQAFLKREFMEQQARFCTGQMWYTSWGKIKSFKRNWPACGHRVQQLLRHHFQI